MPKIEGLNKSISLAEEKLREINIRERLQLLEFDDFDKNEIKLRLFGNELCFNPDTLELVTHKEGKPCRKDDLILFLHYLLNDIPVKKNDEYISFRELSGGQFYWGPFNSRSVKPLIKRMGNNLELLKTNLNRFDWKPDNYGDFSAKIHALGNIHLLLVYHLGDEEFPATAEILFPFTIKHVYKAEDAAVLASRICIGLL